MSFFLERSQLSCPDNINLHLAKVYSTLFPHANWQTLPSFSLDGFALWVPPIIGNSERIGSVYNQWVRTENDPFVLRFELPKHLSKIGMQLTLIDMIIDEKTSDPRKTARFSECMRQDDRFGGIVSAAIGILKPQFYFLPEPPGRSCYDTRMINCLGI